MISIYCTSLATFEKQQQYLDLWKQLNPSSFRSIRETYIKAFLMFAKSISESMWPILRQNVIFIHIILPAEWLKLAAKEN
jgi:hypothetical protein